MTTSVIEIIEAGMKGKVLSIEDRTGTMVEMGRILKVDFYGYGDMSLGVTTDRGIASVNPYDKILLCEREEFAAQSTGLGSGSAD